MNLTNFFEHPADNRYMVYRFQVEDHAMHFEDQMREAGVPFERHEETENNRHWIMYGVHKQHAQVANHANRLTSAKYREKFIPNDIFRWLVLAIGLGAVGIALLGTVMKSKQVIEFYLAH